MNVTAKSSNVVVKLDNGKTEFVPECYAEITSLYGTDPDIDTRTFLKLHREGFTAYYDMDHVVSFTFTKPSKEEEL